MRVIFMGTSEFATPTLEYLIGSEHQIVAVYTRPDRRGGRGQGTISSPVKRVALAHGLTVCQPESLKPSSEVEKIARLSPDVIVVAAFGQILPPGVLTIPPFGCTNVHPSLLPRHRGPSPVADAILSGETITGVSMMLMDSGVDTGPILAQRSEDILPEDTAGSLESRLAVLCARLLEESLALWFEDRLKPQPQDEKNASYSRPITKGDGNMDWHLPAVHLWLRVRAFQPWPGCYTRWHGKSLKVLEASPVGADRGEPGRVVSLAGTTGAVVGVETAEGVLALHRVQLEGRRSVSVADFLRGQRGFVGGLLRSD